MAVQEHHAAPVAQLDEMGTHHGNGCGLTDVCTPVPQAPLPAGATPALATEGPIPQVLTASSFRRFDPSAPPTPPPNS